jgi:hypothetical protein
MKARTTVLSIVAASALIVPAAQARTDYSVGNQTPSSSTEIQALTIRGDALNRRYHLGQYRQSNAAAVRALTIRGEALNRVYGLGAYAPVRFSSDLANSNAVARFLANGGTQTTDALGRYLDNTASDVTATPSFSSDVANSDAVARFQANHGTSVSTGDGVLNSPATDAGIAICLLLVSLGGFMLARRSHRPVRPA